jgi:transposase-like protein
LTIRADHKTSRKRDRLPPNRVISTYYNRNNLTNHIQDMQCPKCGSPSRRDGKTRNKQRWECKAQQCGHHHVEAPFPVGAPATAAAKNPACPYCQGILHKRSRHHSTQYYRCKNCGRGSKAVI